MREADRCRQRIAEQRVVIDDQEIHGRRGPPPQILHDPPKTRAARPDRARSGSLAQAAPERRRALLTVAAARGRRIDRAARCVRAVLRHPTAVRCRRPDGAQRSGCRPTPASPGPAARFTARLRRVPGRSRVRPRVPTPGNGRPPCRNDRTRPTIRTPRSGRRRPRTRRFDGPGRRLGDGAGSHAFAATAARDGIEGEAAGIAVVVFATTITRRSHQSMEHGPAGEDDVFRSIWTTGAGDQGDLQPGPG